MVKIYKNLDFDVNFRKCSVQIFGNIGIGQNFRKILLSAKISKILNFSSFQKFYPFLACFNNPEFGDNYG